LFDATCAPAFSPLSLHDALPIFPARLLGVGEGRRVLDLCAAPGGKTLQLAAAGWQVTSLDASDRRLDMLRANLARTGLAATVIQDRKSTRLNSSHVKISYAVFCL